MSMMRPLGYAGRNHTSSSVLLSKRHETVAASNGRCEQVSRICGGPQPPGKCKARKRAFANTQHGRQISFSILVAKGIAISL